MNLNNISKFTFAWASTVIGSMGAVVLVEERDYFLGLGLMFVALLIEVAREVLKKYGFEVTEATTTTTETKTEVLTKPIPEN